MLLITICNDFRRDCEKFSNKLNLKKSQINQT